MYCNQCEQTAKGIACTSVGVCGKKEDVALLQDLLTFALKGLALVEVEAREKGIKDDLIDGLVLEALFSTLTNVNFDPERIKDYILKVTAARDGLKAKLGRLNSDEPALSYQPAESIEKLIADSKKIGLISDHPDVNIKSLQETLLYSLKGIAAYAYHARVLGHEDERIYSFVYEALSTIGSKNLTMEEWLNMLLKSGEINLITMELLDKANTEAFGHPVPTEVPLGHKKGKCILVSGHDFYDLKVLLEATKDKGIYVYTHGEMLPAHGYPELKKYPHFYGHYGTAWQNQRREFESFPGPILMTTNCLQKPKESYEANIYTAGPVGWPGVKHIENHDYSEIIVKALEMPGFEEDMDSGQVMTGFARNAVLSVADKVIEGVKAGAIRHFLLVGGCDGAKPGRSYYTEIVEKAPEDTVILTLGCGKFRFFDKNLGTIDGIPRLLDVGQCNDAYSAVQIALALAEAFNCDVNELPLSLVLSWFEQKAVSILLTLLYLGIQDIRIGPSLPAFISEDVLKVLSDKFGLKPVTTAEEDLKVILGQ
ncbi:hydroxylamine reductase [Thermosyntropha sp.]|uniref:hydroxylamine reductase n=1 Tax=Thermosyntropha sp. TaxID=2740820 RepID=UPI0025EA1094|nr:hydroxylamine reductase [Thermosyntropha sp.]MBO8158169.1 hydroxylamine reductase [Thermosyntropha sp.]